MWNGPTHENGTFVSQSNPSVGGWKRKRPGFASATFLVGKEGLTLPNLILKKATSSGKSFFLGRRS